MHSLFASLLFVFASSAISQHLARDYEGLPSLRDQLYFDPYDYEFRDEDTRNADHQRAILIQPEEVIDIPPNPLERDDGESGSFDDYQPLKKAGRVAPYREYNSGPAKSRNILQDILSKFNITVIPPEEVGQRCPEVFYSLDDRFDSFEKMYIHDVLDILSKKICLVFTPVGHRQMPDISFLLSGRWSSSFDRGIVRLCRHCLRLSDIITLTLWALDKCPDSAWIPLPPGAIPNTSYDGRSVRENNNPWDDCYDKHHSCPIFARKHLCDRVEELLTICPYSCKVCGKSCVDYSNCDNVGLEECLNDWENMKLRCAKTCGACAADDDCQPKLPSSRCWEFETKGMCEHQREFMSGFCSQSCGNCQFNECADVFEICWSLAESNSCQKYPQFTENFCPRSCGICPKGARTVRGNFWCNLKDDVCTIDSSFVLDYCRRLWH